MLRFNINDTAMILIDHQVGTNTWAKTTPLELLQRNVIILAKFAYKPLLAMLEQRKHQILEGIENAEKTRAELANAQAKAQEIIGQAAQQANKIIEEARTAAAKVTDRRIRVAVEGAVNGWVRCSVADTGPGISPAIADRLFEPFATTKPTGIGLGLAMSRSMIESHGGELWIERGAAGGTVFHFSLPTADVKSA